MRLDAKPLLGVKVTAHDPEAGLVARLTRAKDGHSWVDYWEPDEIDPQLMLEMVAVAVDSLAHEIAAIAAVTLHHHDDERTER